MTKRAVHYGAGNIGRGFIGQLLFRSGYDIVFVDVNDRLVETIRECGTYSVTLANEARDTEWVSRVTAVHGSRIDDVAAEIARAELVTAAVGVSALVYIAESLAAGIRGRIRQGGPMLTVIACENTIGGSSQLQSHVYALLTEEEQAEADRWISFPNAAVDRIVPLQQHDDPLAVTVEPFYEWVIDQSALRGEPPVIAGVHYVEKMEPYISRKLFTVNTGHCSAAYFGYLQGCSTGQQVMADEGLQSKVYDTIAETGSMLCRIYGFDPAEHERYMRTTIDRFANPHLTDEVIRVGRSPIRKLSANDRLVRPVRMAYELGLPVEHLLEAIAAALRFDYPDDPEAAELQRAIREEGVQAAIQTYVGFAADHPLHSRLIAKYEQRGEGRS